MTTRRSARIAGVSAVLSVALLSSGCGAAAGGGREVAPARSGGPPPTATVTPAPATAVAPDGPALGPPTATATAAPQPTLAGVQYIVPPGWQASTPSPAEAALSSESGLSILLDAASGSSAPTVTAATGSPVGVDGSPGYERGGGVPAGYEVSVDVLHGGTRYEVRCTGPDAQDVHNVCDGFMLSLHWAP